MPVIETSGTSPKLSRSDERSVDGQIILALNAGSSSIKFGLFAVADGKLDRLEKGVIENGEHSGFRVQDGVGETLVERQMQERADPPAVIAAMLEWVDGAFGRDRLVAVGHRVVHGGRDFDRPERIDDDVLAQLEALTPLAPLHQSGSLAPIHAIASQRPALPQVACFDTAFHHHLAPPFSRYALPREYEAQGVRKYGFHGLSYESIAGQLRERAPDLAGGRVVVAHLGSGASLCAMRDGRSVDTTMGFSALDGLMMGTRCGAIDPGVILYLQQVCDLDVDEVEDVLYRQSGLVGVSGISLDIKDLSASDDPKAREAIDLFTFMAAKEAAAMTNSLTGIDGLIFTGGVGEHSPQVRARICERLNWLGIEIDSTRNEAAAQVISRRESRIQVLVLPTDEESVIAAHTLALLDRLAPTPGR